MCSGDFYFFRNSVLTQYLYFDLSNLWLLGTITKLCSRVLTQLLFWGAGSIFTVYSLLYLDISSSGDWFFFCTTFIWRKEFPASCRSIFNIKHWRILVLTRQRIIGPQSSNILFIALSCVFWEQSKCTIPNINYTNIRQWKLAEKSETVWKSKRSSPSNRRFVLIQQMGRSVVFQTSVKEYSCNMMLWHWNQTAS